MSHDNFELPTVAALRNDLAKAERERDSLARRLGIRFEETQALRAEVDTMHRVAEGVDQIRATVVTRLDRLRTAADTLLDALDEGDMDIPGHMERLREAVRATRGENDDDARMKLWLDSCRPKIEKRVQEILDTRLTLTDEAEKYLDATRSEGAVDGPVARGAQESERDESSRNGRALHHNGNYGVSGTEAISPSVKAVNDVGETREPVTTERYMMATRATHSFAGDVSRDEPSLAVMHSESATDWIGEWVTGLGLINVHFLKDTTRDLTPEEITLYSGRVVQAGGGAYVIRIPEAGN